MSLRRRVGAVHAIAIELPGTHGRQVDMPDMIRPFLELQPKRFLLGLGPIEQAKLDAARVLGKDREIDALAIPGCSQGMRTAGPGTHASWLRRHQPSRPEILNTCA